MTVAIASLLSIFGVVIGAFLQNYLARQNNEVKQLLESRNQAYIDFFEAISLVASAQRLGKREQELEQLAKLTHAKARICMFGEEHVVKRLAVFWEAGATLETESEILAFTRFTLDIRKSLGLKDKEFISAEVSQLLFSIKPPYS
ncbi:hypothetical protein [Chromobacterium sp. IRSSSOUMB001]|uniref:hypothetical protein n=1 Tax=Chromobacterium sp. IRSSSOUMB001 TaxID=2927123 RepID=UPI0020BF68D8|nr:hypothetical protein [Chromobacterium sp. IRSSSOUMB001]